MKSFRYNKTTIATRLPDDTLLTVTRRLAGGVRNADGTSARNVFDATIAECHKNGWLNTAGGSMNFDAEISPHETRFTGSITTDKHGNWVALNEG